MPHFAKPAEGSWTEHYPELGTAPVNYSDSIDPAYYEAERAAIFKRTWLNVGRVERLPRTGSYFTRELAAAGTSLILVRGRDGQIRAFHNICRHRGNKLVWNDYPNEETAGTCRQFTCKYHAWRYDLSGKLTFVQQEGEFFDLDKADYGLKEVACDIWEGFIFVNLDPRGNAGGIPRGDGRGHRGLPVWRDDRGLHLPGRGRQQLEAVHRRCPLNSQRSSRTWPGRCPPNPNATLGAWPARWTRCRPSTTPPSPARTRPHPPRQVPAPRTARARAHPAAPDAVADHGVVPGRSVEAATSPRQRRRLPGPRRRTQDLRPGSEKGTHSWDVFKARSPSSRARRAARAAVTRYGWPRRGRHHRRGPVPRHRVVRTTWPRRMT